MVQFFKKLAATHYGPIFQKVGRHSNFDLYNINNYWPIFQKVGRHTLLANFSKSWPPQQLLFIYHFSSYARNTFSFTKHKEGFFKFCFVHKYIHWIICTGLVHFFLNKLFISMFSQSISLGLFCSFLVLLFF